MGKEYETSKEDGISHIWEDWKMKIAANEWVLIVLATISIDAILFLMWSCVKTNQQIRKLEKLLVTMGEETRELMEKLRHYENSSHDENERRE